MFHHSYTCIEQLDLAAEQMRRDTPSYSRFALILTDNVVELILHHACLELISIDNIWVKLGKPKYTPKQRGDALGQWFGGKVKFLLQTQKLTTERAEFINICHKYRNELYHAGLLYDDIVFDIAWSYHDLAITLLEKINPNNSWQAMKKVSPAVAKHAGEDGFNILFKMHVVAKSLRSDRPPTKRSLADALSRAAVRRADELLYEMDYVVKNSPQKRTPEKCIFDLQFYDYLQYNSELLGEYRNSEKVFAAIAKLRKKWRPKYKVSSLTDYKRQAEKIAGLESDIQALKAFEKFKSDVSCLGRILDEATIALDSYLDNQLDALRGN